MHLPTSVERSESIHFTEEMFNDIRLPSLDTVFAKSPSDPLVDLDTFRDLFGGHPAAVTIVATEAPSGDPVGVTVTAVMSLSLDPPQLLVSLINGKYTLEAIEKAGTFSVNFLGGDQVETSNVFARPHPDKFSDIAWHKSENHGTPWIDGARANVECVAERFIRSGDHTMIIGSITSAQVTPDVPALLYGARAYGRLGGLE